MYIGIGPYSPDPASPLKQQRMFKKFISLILMLSLSGPALAGSALAGSCDYSWQRAKDGSLCGKRAADQRPGGRHLGVFVETVIKTAIKEKHAIRFIYQGVKIVTHPHEWSGNAQGKNYVLCWQDGGGLLNSGASSWKRFPLREMKELEMLNESFVKQKTYNKKNSTNILVSVDD